MVKKSKESGEPRNGMNGSIKIALGLLLVIILYFVGGLFIEPEEVEGEIQEAGGKPIVTVRVRTLEAEEIAREVIVTGHTGPSREVEIRAETGGQVSKVIAERGRYVEAGELLVELELDDRNEQLERAEASVEEARLEWEAAKRLREKSLGSDSQVAGMLAQYRAAQQALKSIELEIERTKIRAPFGGILNERYVEKGDYLSIGDPVAHILDPDPLVISGGVNEFEIQHVHPGEHGIARLAGGKAVDGTIRYVAGQASKATRTFPMELSVPNPEQQYPIGITAEIAIETERVYAHKVSPALISIADDGRFGVKYVDESNRVQFVEADLVKSSPDWVWLGSLPKQLQLITVGQGFTQEGDLVKTEPDTGSW